MDFNKFASNYGDIFFIIAIIEAIIIIALVIYFIYKIKDIEDESKRLRFISDVKKANHNDENSWRDEYNKVVKELNQLKKRNRTNPVNNNAHLSLVDNNNESARNETEDTNQLNDGFADYARKETEKGIYVKETPNEDGTVKSEIDFDLTNNEPASDLYNEPAPVLFTPKYDYLEAANGGQFRKLFPSDEKSFFRTWEENGVRKFEFHGNIENALANFNAVFDDVCEIEGKQNGATHIINVKPGILSSQLKVEKKAQIKLT